MHDLPGCLAGARIETAALAASQDTQRGAGQFGAQRQHHAGGPDAVAAEQRQVPRGAGAEERVTGCVRLDESQRFQVVEGSREEPFDATVGGDDLGPGPFGRRVGFTFRRSHDGVAVGHPYVPFEQHAAAGRDLDVPAQRREWTEVDATVLARGVGVVGRCVRTAVPRASGGSGADHDFGAGGMPDQAARVRLGLLGEPGATAFHHVDIGEVARDLDGHVGTDRLGRSGRDADVFDDGAGADMPKPVHAHGRVGARVAELPDQRHEVRAADAGCRVPDRLRLVAVDAQHGTRQDPSIRMEDAVHTGAANLSVVAGQGNRWCVDRADEIVQ